MKFYLRFSVSVFVLLFLALNSVFGIGSSKYSKRVEFSSVKINYLELQALLDKAVSLVNLANGTKPIFREQLEIVSDGVTYKRMGHQLDLGQPKTPAQISSLEFTLYAEDAPIESIFIRLNEYSRSIQVEGSNSDQVDAVSSALRVDLQQYLTNDMGGTSVLYIFRTLSIPLLLGLLHHYGKALFETKNRRFIIPMLIVLGIFGLIYSPLFREFFSGFLAVRGDAAFLVRNGPLLSFISLIIGLISLPITGYKRPAKEIGESPTLSGNSQSVSSAKVNRSSNGKARKNRSKGKQR